MHQTTDVVPPRDNDIGVTPIVAYASVGVVVILVLSAMWQWVVEPSGTPRGSTQRATWRS